MSGTFDDVTKAHILVGDETGKTHAIRLTFMLVVTVLILPFLFHDSHRSALAVART